ncbi:MAG: oligosaccharide flippase family protein [Leptospirales bacterium]|nr:oligosaccharide flippase family protein [Leptospirales bacterium]
MKDKSRIFLNSIIVFTSTIIENIIFFVINIIIARYLSIEHFGEYSTALGYATFFLTLSNIGINQTLVRLINLYPDKKNENFSTAFILRCIVGTFIYAIMAVSLFLTNYSYELVILTLIMGVFRMGSEFLLSFYYSFDAEEKFILSSIFRITFSIAFLILTICVVLFHGSLFHFAYVRLWLVIVFFIILIATYGRFISFRMSYKTLYSFFIESIPFGISTILFNIYQRINIIILSLIHGSIYSGVFSNGFVFFTTLFLIPWNITRVLIPYLYKVSHKDNPAKFQFAFDIYNKFLAIISFYFMTGALLYGKEVIYLIFGSKYHDSIIILQIVSIGIPFIFTIAPAIITSLDKQPMLTKIYIVGFLISIISNISLIYFYKSEGAAASAVITYGYIFIATNYYLSTNKFVNVYGIIKIYCWQLIILFLCYCIKTFIIPEMFWIASLAIISIAFIILNLIFVINKDDVRIVREILNIDKFPVKIYKK